MLLLLLASCTRAVASAQFFPRLAEVRRLYVAPFGSGVDAERVRDQVRQLLSESGRFTIVDEASAADAILGGVAGVKQIETTNVHVNDGVRLTSETHRVGFGRLRLFAAGSPDTVWTFEYRIGLSLQKPAIRVANQAVQHLLADAAEADSVSAVRRAKESSR
jgi:hypothetical protein